MSKRRMGGRPPDQARRRKRRDVFVSRPFEGLIDEPEWIALRELVPAATAPLRLAPDLAAAHPGREVLVATLLPVAYPAMVHTDGRVFVGLQRQVDSGDPNRDIAASILAALAAESPGLVDVPADSGDGPRLADVLADGRLEVTVYDSFEFWGTDADPAVAASLERANKSIYPTVRMRAAPAAYWCRVPERAHVRWVLPEPEDAALTALARLSAAGELKLGGDTRFAGMFRAHGLLVPVWDLPLEPAASHWEEPLAALAKRYADVLTVEEPLDASARRARQGLIGRQLTLR